MRIAIIGSGISGLVAAYRLNRDHDVTVYEANGYVGGHTNTVVVNRGGQTHAVDTGFIVFNDRTYPGFCSLLDELQVKSRPTSMSFSVRSDAENLEYSGSGLPGLFAQKRNLLRPGFYRMIRDILRFNREAPQLLQNDDRGRTVADFLTRNKYSAEFARHYLLPMGAAIWSCPTSTFAEFPIHFICEFYHNHGLLSLKDRPTWRVIQGGSWKYVQALTESFRDRIRLSTPVRSIQRREDSVCVNTDEGPQLFDEVVMACHSDQALNILGDHATRSERTVLSAIPYEPNTAVFHTDERVLPRRRSVWSSWNYHLPTNESEHATLTYNMNLLQHIESDETFCVTLNDVSGIAPEKVIAKYRYSHPIFTVARSAAQQRHHELIRSGRVSFCGAYWGNGFHEDGVASASRVVEAFRQVPQVRLSESGAHA
ncbi:MAG: FAD-dependent oxidoreductase [Fuerstiella sp.]